MTVHHLEAQIYYYTFGPHEPALRIRSGDTVVAETRDAFGYDTQRNPLPDAMKQQSPGTSLRESNPLVGPIYVEELLLWLPHRRSARPSPALQPARADDLVRVAA
jgi:acetamidase/formamidase